MIVEKLYKERKSGVVHISVKQILKIVKIEECKFLKCKKKAENPEHG